MTLPRPLLHVAGAALVFVVGWTAGGARYRPAPAAGSTPTAAEPTACTDPFAMAANATLVGEVRDARRDLALARERIQANAPPAEPLPGRLQSAPEDWSRRATDDNVTVRVPCARWDGAPSFTVRGAHRTDHLRRGSDARVRADFLGLSPGERETLAQVYARTQTHVWQSIRRACESDDDYRKTVADETDADDSRRIAVCRDALVDAAEPATRRAYREVAALRARGRPSRSERLDARASVLFALTGAPEALFDEMKRTFGQESATRLIDHGVACFDENAYDLRAREPDG